MERPENTAQIKGPEVTAVPSLIRSTFARSLAVLGLDAQAVFDRGIFAYNFKGLSKILRMVESLIGSVNIVKPAHSRPMGDDMLPAFTPV